MIPGKMATPSNECLTEYRYLFSSDLLRGKVALITGGGSGIGFTIAEIFLRHGCDVVIASRHRDKLDRACGKLRAATAGNCSAITMDVRQPDQVTRAVETVLDKYKSLDILVNAAAGNFLCPINALSLNAYKTVLDIDTVGTFLVSKMAFQKYMQAHGGVILNISATLHYRGQLLQAHAGSAKAAIDALTKHMAVEWGNSNVRVVGVAPGPIANTEGMSRLGGGQQELIGRMIPLGRLGERVEIAHTALFLASSAASYITGETLVADGGAWLGPPNPYEFYHSNPSKL